MTSPRTGLALLTGGHGLIHIYSNIHLVLIPVFILEFELSLLEASFIATIPLLCQTFATLASGVLTDKLQPARIVALSLVISIIGAGLAYSSTIFPLLVLSFSILATSITLFHPPAYALVSELIPQRRNLSMGIMGAAGTLGIAVGPIIMGVLMVIFGWRTFYALLAVPILLYLVIFSTQNLSFRPIHHEADILVKEPEPQSRSIYRRGFAFVVTFTSASMMGRQIIWTYLSTYLVREWDLLASSAAVLVGTLFLMGVVSGPTSGIIADRIGEKKWLTLTYSCSLLSLLVVIFGSIFSTVLIGLFSYHFFMAVDVTVTATLIARFSPKKRRGMAYGIFHLPGYVLGAFSPVLAAYAAERQGISSIFPLAMILIFTALLVIRQLPPDIPRKDKMK